MNYFNLKPAVDTEETGNQFPAVETPEDYDFKSANSAHRIKTEEFPKFVPDLRFKLAPEAKFTDIIGQATISVPGLLISKKVKEILEKYDLVPSKFYSAEIAGSKADYFWIHPIWKEGIEFVNYQKSEWRIKEFSHDLGSIELLDRKDHLIKQGELGFMKMIYGNPIVISNPNFDLFVDPLNFGIYVSQQLANDLQSSEVSGMELKPASKVVVEN